MTTLALLPDHKPGYGAADPVDGPWTVALLGQPAFAMHAYGTPAPQGSKNARAIYKGKGEARQFTGKVAMHESSKKVKPWREVVAAFARNYSTISDQDGEWELLDGPLVVDMVFTMPKGTTLPKYLDWHFRTPDLSKLARSTEDALTGIVWQDDARITAYRRLEKRYEGSDDFDALDQPGVVVRVWKVPGYLIETRKWRARNGQL